jgi:hypothetical protein
VADADNGETDISECERFQRVVAAPIAASHNPPVAIPRRCPLRVTERTRFAGEVARGVARAAGGVDRLNAWG